MKKSKTKSSKNNREELQLQIKGRLKELWKPILQIASGLPVYQSLFLSVEDQRKERLGEKQNTLEGQIVKAVYDVCIGLNGRLIEISFSNIWEKLRENLDGKVDAEKSYIMHTSEFFDLSKKKIGFRLREVLSSKSKTIRSETGEVVKAYDFDFEKLSRVSKKYNLDVTKLPMLPISERTQGQHTPEKHRKTNDKTPEKDTHALESISYKGNLVTRKCSDYCDNFDRASCPMFMRINEDSVLSLKCPSFRNKPDSSARSTSVTPVTESMLDPDYPESGEAPL